MGNPIDDMRTAATEAARVAVDEAEAGIRLRGRLHVWPRTKLKLV